MVAAEPVVMPLSRRIIPLRPTRAIPGTNAPSGPDSALQTRKLPLVGIFPGLNFDGVSANGFAPPDRDCSVGTTQFMEMTNVEFAIYDESNGNLLLGPALIHTIWNGFGDAKIRCAGVKVVSYATGPSGLGSCPKAVAMRLI